MRQVRLGPNQAFYHDHVVEYDLQRQAHLESQGWKVIRFSDKDVKESAETVARAIASELNLKYEFAPRKATGSGMRSVKAKQNRRR